MDASWFLLLMQMCIPICFLLIFGVRRDPWTPARIRRSLRLFGVAQLAPMSVLLYFGMHAPTASPVIIGIAVIMVIASISSLIIAWRIKDPPDAPP